VSFLLAEGHTNARRYPLRMVWDEVRLARSRVDTLLASQALLTQMVVNGLFSKESVEAFSKTIKELTRG
jgi:hypothetical protein